ncbi:hypothetical protein CALVIDRAFT_207384 [Calocera viscosa TUFC12733]|uniref:Uncharacterized protein n=1 Tax=Calocera viscosa (strain TUFC12733) TaxID=1330018 RepID=A0A167R8U9_CALVF|nr:hypothetical protein CALVIDRAFT_207384 [Calocera viscosa TUFC12733]
MPRWLVLATLSVSRPDPPRLPSSALCTLRPPIPSSNGWLMSGCVLRLGCRMCSRTSPLPGSRLLGPSYFLHMERLAAPGRYEAVIRRRRHTVAHPPANWQSGSQCSVVSYSTMPALIASSLSSLLSMPSSGPPACRPVAASERVMSARQGCACGSVLVYNGSRRVVHLDASSSHDLVPGSAGCSERRI